MRMPSAAGHVPALALVALLAPLHTAFAQPLPNVPLDDASRARLEASAGDPALDDWQRDLMRRLATRGKPAAAPAVAMPGGALTADPADGIWQRLPPPPMRNGHSAIYDPIRNRMIIFAGTQLDDLWELRLGGTPAWREIVPAGIKPPPRYGHSAIFDPVRDRMIVFGGFNDYGVGVLEDTWALALSGPPVWEQIGAGGDTTNLRRFQHTAIYDPVGDRMIVFGGFGTPYQYSPLPDCRALSLSGTPVWSLLSPEADPVAGPISARARHTAFYDFVRQRMVVYGGNSVTDPFFYQPVLSDEVWALDLAGPLAWTRLLPMGTDSVASLRKRCGHAAAYDALRDRLVVFAGRRDALYYYGGLPDNQTWALDLGSLTWAQLDSTGDLPSPRESHSAIWDPVGDRVLVYGAPNYYGVPDMDVWSYSATDTAGWSRFLVGGGQPPNRYGHTALYDETNQRIVVFGGISQTNTYLNDTWALSLTGDPLWSHLLPAGTLPPGRMSHTAVYDRTRDRMLIFGGYGGAYRNDVWALALSGSPAWTRILPSGVPPSSRTDHACVYDPAGDRMLVFGGYSGAYRDDAWQLSFAGAPAWSPVQPPGEWPSGRYGHSAIWDEPRGRMVVFGGRDGLYSLNDVWALSTDGGPAWTRLVDAAPQTGPLRASIDSIPPSSPESRSHHGVIYDPSRQRMVIYAGLSGPTNYVNLLTDVWSLSLAGTPSWRKLEPVGDVYPYYSRLTTTYDPLRDRMVVLSGEWGSGSVDYVLQWSGVVAVPEPVPPAGVALAIAPNPARGGASIVLDLSAESDVEAALFDLAGRRVQGLAAARLPAGRHTLRWNGRGAAGEAAPPGVYFVRVRAAGREFSKRLVLLD